MTSIYLIDTGHITVDRRTSQLATVDIANSGKPIILRSVELQFRRGLNVEDSPVPALFQDKTINIVSFDNPLIVVRGVIIRGGKVDLDNDDDSDDAAKELAMTLADEGQILALLDRLVTTKGVKLLYMTEDSIRATKFQRGMTYYLGTTETTDATSSHNHTTPGIGEIGAAVKHLHVFVKGINITERAANRIDFDLTLQVTK